VTAGIVRTLIDLGMRVATPGEFTLRAFLNRKLDLSQAEAVRDLVNSRTEYQARQAREQLDGALSRRLEPLRVELVRIVSQMETALEFVEDDVSPEGREALIRALQAVDSRLGELESGFHFGRLLQEGAEVTIVGRPNAGKSSVFNALLKDDRAIVTEIPGTTRDALRETVNLAGIPAHLVDTAGIRESEDRLEKAGMEKSLEYIKRSDVICFVVDGFEAFSADDRRIWEAVRDLPGLRFMRDPTRGGLATVAHEIARACGHSVALDQTAVPLRPEVVSVCEMLGYDPYYLACEGRVVAVADASATEEILTRWQALPEGRDACRIGRVEAGDGRVILATQLGGRRVLDELEDDPLPRIC